MRRFEFRDGSSNKFWQISVTGSELQVSYGKLGTAGQTQSKSFASAGAAQAEHDKLIAEKTKKGYAEVSADGAVMPAPKPAAPKAAATPVSPSASAASAATAPAPAASASAPAASGPAPAALDALPEAVRPGEPEDAPSPPSKLPDPATCLAEIQKEFKAVTWAKHTLITELKSGLSHASGRYRELAERLLATYAAGKAPAALDADGDAALLHTVQPGLAVAYLLQRGGLSFVVEALIRSMYMQRGQVGGQSGSYTYFEDQPPRLDWSVPSSSIIAAVRERMPALPAAEIAAARAIAERARKELLTIRVGLAMTFSDRAWMAEDAAALLALKKNEYHYSTPAAIFSQLRDAELIGRLAARHPSDVPIVALVDELGLAAAPAVIASFLSDPKNEYRAETLARLETVAVAKAFVSALPTKRAVEIAKAFYARRPDLAIVALAPVVARGDNAAAHAKPVLDAIVKANPGLPARLGAHLDAKSRALFEGAQASAAAAVPEATAAELPAILSAPLPAPKRGTAALPAFVDVGALPRVLLRDKSRSLPEPAQRTLLTLLQRSTLTEPHPGLAQVEAACDGASLSALVWALFEQWLSAGVGSKENWAFTALGLLGDDEVARRLTPLIRIWPGESQHARAGLGLDILAAIGTDLSLMHLHGVAEKVKFKALQEKAREKIDAIAAARGLTTEDLADRLVPDLGLDASGSLVLDFGGRSFQVGFDESLTPTVRDASSAAGKALGELPKPGKSDDAGKAAAATERWKTLKKDARAVAATQLVRLELAMCAQRRWKYADFAALILRHPLLVHLVRRLVWGVFDGAKLEQTFRVAEDSSLASEDDAPLTLAQDAVVGLVHRLELPPALLGKWGGLFADYKILQPFEQLGRQVYQPSSDEAKGSVLKRGKLAAKTGKVMGLQERGWRKGEAQDAGWVYDLHKPLPGGFVASIGLGGGLCMGAPQMNPPTQSIDGLSLGKGSTGKATFGQLSPTAFSELVRDYESLRE